MLKQLHIVPDIEAASGGLGLAALRFAEALAEAGANVTLFTTSSPSRELLATNTNAASFELLHAGIGTARPGDLMRTYRMVDGLCADRGFDLVHMHGSWLPLFALAGLIARRRRIPIVISPHGNFEPWALNHRRWKKRLALWTYQRMVNRAATLFFASAEQEMQSIRNLGIRQPVAVVPNGVDLNAVPPRARTAKRTILFLSRIHPKKGLMNLVEAWAEVRNPQWRIRIAGPDVAGYRAEVQAAIDARGMASDFEFVGMVQGAAKTACFAAAELFVLPTYSENFGIAVAEALAHEVPVITTTGAPWSDLVEHRCGWWIAPGAAALAQALRAAMTVQPEELRNMGRRGRQLVANKYSWSGVARIGMQAYASALTQELQPDR